MDIEVGFLHRAIDILCGSGTVRIRTRAAGVKSLNEMMKMVLLLTLVYASTSVSGSLCDGAGTPCRYTQNGNCFAIYYDYSDAPAAVRSLEERPASLKQPLVDEVQCGRNLIDCVAEGSLSACLD
jgi:hypothetical protein